MAKYFTKALQAHSNLLLFVVVSRHGERMIPFAGHSELDWKKNNREMIRERCEGVQAVSRESTHGCEMK